MSVQALPPLVASFEVQQFLDDLDQAVRDSGFILLLNPISDVDAPQFEASEVERRLLALTRLAAQATYWSGSRVAKIVDLGDRWDPADTVGGYLRTAAVANHLKALSRSGFASLGRIDEWATAGPPTTLAFAQSVELIQRTMQMMHAIQLPLSQRMVELDLWFEHKTTPFRVESSHAFFKPPDAFLSTGHLIEVEPPAFRWTTEESPLLQHSRSPLAVTVTPSTVEFVEKVIAVAKPNGRHLLLKAASLELVEPVLHLAAQTRDDLVVSVLLQVHRDADGPAIAADLERARMGGAAAIGVEVLVRTPQELAPACDAASLMLEQLYVRRR